MCVKVEGVGLLRCRNHLLTDLVKTRWRLADTAETQAREGRLNAKEAARKEVNQQALARHRWGLLVDTARQSRKGKAAGDTAELLERAATTLLRAVGLSGGVLDARAIVDDPIKVYQAPTDAVVDFWKAEASHGAATHFRGLKSAARRQAGAQRQTNEADENEHAEQLEEYLEISDLLDKEAQALARHRTSRSSAAALPHEGLNEAVGVVMSSSPISHAITSPRLTTQRPTATVYQILKRSLET